jgi:hypothetical protein
MGLSFTTNLDKSLAPGWTLITDLFAKYKIWSPELSVITTNSPYMVIGTEYFLYSVSWAVSYVVWVIFACSFLDTLVPIISCKVSSK